MQQKHSTDDKRSEQKQKSKKVEKLNKRQSWISDDTVLKSATNISKATRQKIGIP